MKRVLIVSGLVALLVAGFMAHPTGSPSSVCDDLFMEPIFHRDNLSATGYNNTDQYSLQTQSVEDNSGRIQVILSGATFKGFVVRATTSEEENLGEFIENGTNVPFKNLNCSSHKDVAVTHSNPDPKSSITLMWENRNKDKPVFQATVVPDIDSYVINIYES